MIDKMLQHRLIFAPTHSGARTQSQRQDPGLCYNNANTSINHHLMMLFSVLANDEQGHQNVYFVYIL